MNPKSKKIAIFAIVGVLLVSAVAFLPALDINFLATGPSTITVASTIKGSTGTYSFCDSDGKNCGSQYIHDKIRDKTILQGTSREMLDDVEYVTGWYANGDSEKINVNVGNYEQIYTWNAGHSGTWGVRPSVLVGRYWYDVYYYSTPDCSGTGTKIIGKTTYNTAYCTITSGSNTKQKFAHVTYKNDYSKFSLGGETEWWWPDPQPTDYKQTTTLIPGSIAFKMTGQRAGSLKVQLIVEYSELAVWGLLNTVFGYHYDSKVVKEDKASLKSGIGDIDVTSKNSLTGVPGYDAGGTGDDYTKYIYNEGQTMTFHIKTGVSGATTGNNLVDKRWKFEILAGGTTAVTGVAGVTGLPYIPDNWEGDLTWTIPIGTGNKDFTAKLTNGLITQSEDKVYSVKEISKIPGRTTMISPANGATFTLGQSVTFKFSAAPNPVTLSPIVRFDGGAKYSKTGSYFWSSSQITATNNQGQFTITPERVGPVYVKIVACDKAGNFGAPNTENNDYFITVNAIPKYLVTITVVDSKTSSPVSDATVVFGSSTQTTVNGITQFTVETGTYTLTVSKTGYKVFTQTGNQIAASKTIPISLVPTGEPTPPPTPPTTQDVTITVYDSSTELTVSDASVTLGTSTKTTASNGQIKFTDVATGPQSLYVTKENFEDFTQDLTIPDDLIEGIFAVQLIPGTSGPPSGTTYEVNIDVLDADGVAIEDASVQIGSDTQTTDTYGSVKFNLVADTYDVVVSKTGYETKTESVAVTDITFTQITLTAGDGPTPPEPPSGSTFTMTVSVTSSGSPVSGASVILGPAMETTGAEGTAVLSNIPGGENYLTVAKTDYNFYTETVTITMDSTLDVVLTSAPIPPPPGEKCTVTITVRDSASKTILEGAKVTIGDISQTTTASGVISIDVDQGTALVKVEKDGYVPFVRSINIDNHMTFTVSLMKIKGTPGFELVTLIAAFGVAFILFNKTRKKKDE